jgi:peptidoglycan hydrolase-like protein with peptidoglycan-binding domain
MIRILLVILLTLGASFSVSAQENRVFNEVSIVALIITSGPETAVSASVTQTLESLDAQTLQAVGPNASELRSILKRFAAAAIDTDIALVYFDGAVLKIDDRAFVAPGGISLRRPSDLLTRAIPISALARATALAANGGAVLVHSSAQGITLIDGVTLAEHAPAPRTGTSPVLFAAPGAADALAKGLGVIADIEGDIDLNEALSQLAALNGVTISQLPSRAAPLRRTPPPAAPVEVAEAVTIAEVPETETTGQVGINLPQIGNSGTQSTAPEAQPESAQDGHISPPDAAAEGAASPVGTAEPQPAPQDMELSIDVLRAMQSALTRAQKRQVQLSLRNLHFYRGLIDGIFGRQSEHAISAYQQSIGANVTGVLTPIQLQSLSE